MAAAHEDALLEQRWETAYWLGNLMTIVAVGPQKKPKGYRADALMKPFLPRKTGTEIANERRKFFEDFERKRRAALNGGGT
jgi:hypothetical protein